VLKGEVKSAGSFRIHTVESLSGKSRGDAELIAKLGCFAIWFGAIQDEREMIAD
jgi:hypothetical protein